MKIILFAPVMEQTCYCDYQRETGEFNPGQKFYTLLKQGLEENGLDVEVFAFSSEKSMGYKGCDPRFHYVSISSKAERRLAVVKLGRMAAGVLEAEDAVLADVESYWSMRAALYCKKASRHAITGVITDFSYHVYRYSEEWGQDNAVFRSIKYAYQYYKLLAVRKADAYVLLTEAMANVVGKDKPHVVVEGFSQVHTPAEQIKHDDGKRHICYFGHLNGQSGIERLADCCMALDRDDFVLHVYGDGAAKQSIIKTQEKDSRIVYEGVVSLDEVSRLEQQADLLINPRPTKEPFNRYSFPSKTLEYMSSGTAAVTTKLECIPKEYDKYLLYLDDTSFEAMKTSLNDILNIPEDVLLEKGQRAKQFALSEKSPRQQAEKILNLVRRVK